MTLAWPTERRPSRRKACSSGASFKQAQGVGDDDAALADLGGGLLLSQVELPDQLGVAPGFLDGVEVFALEVFDEGQFQDGAIIGLADDDGDLGQAEHLGGAPAAFAGDQLEMIVLEADDERLHDALFLDGVGQFAEGFGGKILARLQAGRADPGDGDPLDGFRGCHRLRPAGTAKAGAAAGPDAPLAPSKALRPRPRMGFAMGQKLRANGGRGKGKRHEMSLILA